VHSKAGLAMKQSISAAAFRHWLVFVSASCTAAAAFSCSAPGKESGVQAGAPGAPATGGAAATGGAGALPGTAGTLSLGPVNQEQPNGPCRGLECQVPACDGNPKATTISGKVYDPAGKTPLYNVVVYVPNGPVEPFKEGAACDRCGASIVNPVTSAITDETGSFKLEGAPAGASVPLVIQVGKWRRQIVVPAVTGCADTPLTDPQLTRLPRNKTEGDIPRIAIAAGGADQMECLPRRLGIDDSEFTAATGDGRIHLYSGHDDGERGQNHPINATAAGPLTSATELWASVDSLKAYDIVILSCEGNSYEDDKPMTSRQALYDYASLGGRVFASHWHNIWFENGPDPLPTTGTWETRMPNPAGNAMNRNGDDTPIRATINQTFPKGEALAKWLVNVGASSMLGQMDVIFPRDNIQAVNPAIAREWITVDNPNFAAEPKAVQYMSFNTPIGVPEEQVCGRQVYTNLHVSAVDNTTVERDPVFPAACEVRDLSAQEKAVAFMLFDLSACVMSDELEPKPPK
jgi:hypothetical protein